MSKSKIEWTDRTWNPVTGCTKVSQGCKNCYAERLYERFHGHGSFKDVLTHPERLQQPLHWKKPSMVFVNSMSDLFHEDVPFEFINDVFKIMRMATDHTFQILTKRPERMIEFFNWLRIDDKYWPLKNVWLGVSVEDQATADERIPLLLQVPAAVRFLSCEPLLGPIDLMFSINGHKRGPSVIEAIDKIQWVICGGESGPGARPMHPDWARSIRDQCAAAGVAFFFKQWGEWRMWEHDNDENKRVWFHGIGNPVIRIGKHKAGNLLDGKQHLEFPQYVSAEDVKFINTPTETEFLEEASGNRRYMPILNNADTKATI